MHASATDEESSTATLVAANGCLLVGLELHPKRAVFLTKRTNLTQVLLCSRNLAQVHGKVPSMCE